MTLLRRMTAPEFDAWLARAVPEYAADKVASGQWRAEEAEERSRLEHAQLLPSGPLSPGHHFFTLVDDASGDELGMLWFAVRDRSGVPVAYVFKIEVALQRRRQGHAARALIALEREVAALGLHGVALHVFGHNAAARALYAKLGYEPTNINLFKAVPPPQPGAVEAGA
jgi:ribosomal protein S18 acetylase RimI-like enzyme